MIAYVDTPPLIEPHGEGFIVKVRSGETETAYMLTLHALSGLAMRGKAYVAEAQAKAVLYEPRTFQLRQTPKSVASHTKRKSKD